MPAPDGRLRVAIDGRYWRSAIQTGVERYILLLLEALQAAEESVDVGLVVRAAEAEAFAGQGFSSVSLLPVADRRTTSLRRTLDGFSPAIVHFPFDVPARLDFPSVYTLHEQATTEPFLLAVGVYIPTKNIPRLCRAFRLARGLAPKIVPPRLVLVGRIGWERGFPVKAPDITVLGHVSDDELATLYASCTAFVFPSFYEGFGIPVHEALLAGAPVLCADTPVFREIGGDLVHYADPHDDVALAEAIVARRSGGVISRLSRTLDMLIKSCAALRAAQTAGGGMSGPAADWR